MPPPPGKSIDDPSVDTGTPDDDGTPATAAAPAAPAAPAAASAAEAAADGGPLRPVVQQRSLRQQVAGALRDEMMSGRLPAGTRFTVREIADLYEVSATPVREALVDLTSQGLLWMEHNRGFRVPLFTWDDYLEIVNARALVSDGILRRVAHGATGVDLHGLASLRARARSARDAVHGTSLDVVVDTDRRFWAELGAMVAGPRVADYLDWLRVQVWVFAAPLLRGHEDLHRYCWTGQLDLVADIAAGDGEGVRLALRRYNREALSLMAALCGVELTGRELAGLFEPPDHPLPHPREPRP